jgi:large conductance mechanosensitive channel
MLREFRDFAVRGNVVDMAVGIIVGAAFGAIVSSLVADVIMPPIGLALGGVDFSNLFVVLKPGTPPGPYASVADAKMAGAVTLNYGLFINNVLSFLIVALAVFFMIRGMNRLRGQAAAEPAPTPTTRACPFCFTEISLKATRCPHCTSQLTS